MATQFSHRILDFFNKANDAWEIRHRIYDDPNFGLGSRAYGISLSRAQNIIDYRNTLPIKQFTSLHEIDATPGIGSGTMHNILYSFNLPSDISKVDGEYYFADTVTFNNIRLKSTKNPQFKATEKAND